MKAVIYLRVATAEQLSNSEADKQRRICQEYADEHDLSIIKEITKTGTSGVQRYSRCKGLRDIEKMAKDGDIDAVLVSDTSRLTRNTHTMIDFQKRMKELGVQVHSVQGGRLFNLFECKEAKLIERVYGV